MIQAGRKSIPGSQVNFPNPAGAGSFPFRHPLKELKTKTKPRRTHALKGIRDHSDLPQKLLKVLSLGETKRNTEKRMLLRSLIDSPRLQGLHFGY